MKIIRHPHRTPGVSSALAEIVVDVPLFGQPMPESEEENLVFQMDTYKKLMPPDASLFWDAQFLSVNNFLATLGQDDVYVVRTFYLSAKKQLLRISVENYREVVATIALEVSNMAFKIGLLPRLQSYVVDAKLPIPESARNIVMRPQDTNEMTFRYPEYVQLTAISLLCKMMSPVWGDFVSRVENKIIDNVNKETFCLAMIESLVENSDLGPVYDKLSNYLEKVAESEARRMQGSTANKNEVRFLTAFGGFSSVRLYKTIYAIIFVKKFANVDLLQQTCDLMKYINVSINATFKARLSAFRKPNTQARSEIQTSDADRDNASYLEHESRPSAVTADTPVLIRMGVRAVIPMLLKKYTIARANYDEAVAYFRRFMVTPTPFNRMVLSLMFGRHIGGAAGLRYLKMDVYLELVALAQLVLAQRNESELAHLLSATVPSKPKDEMGTSADLSIASNMATSSVYRQVVQLYPTKVEGKSVTSHLDALREWVTDYHHYYNTPPVVAQILDEDQPANGAVIVYEDTVMIAICDLVLSFRDEAMEV